MHPVTFEGAVEVKKPENMTDEECMSVWAKFGWDRLWKLFQLKGMGVIPPALYAGIDADNFPYYMTAWKPNKEDIEAINKGLPVYIKTLSRQLPPMAVFTLNENNEPNWE